MPNSLITLIKVTKTTKSTSNQNAENSSIVSESTTTTTIESDLKSGSEFALEIAAIFKASIKE